MQKRHIAHITLKADTPLKVGSNASDFYRDAPVQKDWNGLPMILGTSITGVLRKEFTGDKEDIFGEENGSKVIISNALLVGDDGKVCESILLDKTKNKIFSLFENLPLRQHTAINAKGVAVKGSKFDEEVVYKGSRFKFSIEFLEPDATPFLAILELLKSSSFRLGGGSTKGFGSFEILSIEYAFLDLNDYTSSLNFNINGAKEPNLQKMTSHNHIAYTLKLKPDDFFMFGSGFGDSDADMTPVYESVVDYDKSSLSEQTVLIPASSIKGAIAHRTTYHYNKLLGNTIESKNAIANIEEIFGQAKDSKNDISGAKGKFLISDCFKVEIAQTKAFDHVSIDRFTGGAINGALFQEKTIADDNEEYVIELLLDRSVQDKALEALEQALRDITTGMLALGGATTKGHGVFRGTVLKNGEQL